MWPFKKTIPPLRTEDAEIIAARAAQARAHSAIEQVQQQQQEVAELVRSLERRRQRNNFGRALEIAMEGRR
jgi:hypothetical protein